MVADVILEEETVRIEGNLNTGANKTEGELFTITGPDLRLDCPRRRGKNTHPKDRRALVHVDNFTEDKDGLVINYEHDYPAGVRICGPVEIQGDFIDDNAFKTEGELFTITGPDLRLDCPRRRGKNTQPKDRRALVHLSNDALAINHRNDYPGGVRICGPVEIVGSLKIDKDIQCSRIQGLSFSQEKNQNNPDGTLSPFMTDIVTVNGKANFKGPIECNKINWMTFDHVEDKINNKTSDVVTIDGDIAITGKIRFESKQLDGISVEIFKDKIIVMEKPRFGMIDTTWDVIKEVQNLRTEVNLLKSELDKIKNNGNSP